MVDFDTSIYKTTPVKPIDFSFGDMKDMAQGAYYKELTGAEATKNAQAKRDFDESNRVNGVVKEQLSSPDAPRLPDGTHDFAAISRNLLNKGDYKAAAAVDDGAVKVYNTSKANAESGKAQVEATDKATAYLRSVLKDVDPNNPDTYDRVLGLAIKLGVPKELIANLPSPADVRSGKVTPDQLSSVLGRVGLTMDQMVAQERVETEVRNPDGTTTKKVIMVPKNAGTGRQPDTVVSSTSAPELEQVKDENGNPWNRNKVTGELTPAPTAASPTPGTPTGTTTNGQSTTAPAPAPAPAGQPTTAPAAGQPAAGQPAPAPAGQPAPAAGQKGQPLSQSTNVADVANGIFKAEGGLNGEKNSKSSAQGPGQMIDSTFISQYKKLYPEQAAKMTPQQILAQRGTRDANGVAIEFGMARDLIDTNAKGLQASGIEPNGTNVYLAHFAGLGGAKALLNAKPDAPAVTILGQPAIDANPFLKNMTAADVIAWAGNTINRASGTSSTPLYSPGATGDTRTPQGNQLRPYDFNLAAEDRNANRMGDYSSGLASPFASNTAPQPAPSTAVTPPVVNDAKLPTATEPVQPTTTPAQPPKFASKSDEKAAANTAQLKIDAPAKADALIAYNQTADRSIALLKQIRDNPNLDSYTATGPIMQGPILGRFTTRQGTANLEEDVKSATGDAFLGGLSRLKSQSKTGSSGLGSVSNIEGEKVTKAELNIDLRQSPEQIRRNLDKEIAELEEGKKNMNDSFAQLYAPHLSEDKAKAVAPLISGEATSNPTPTPPTQLPTTNSKGWTLHEDGQGRKAYVSPDGKSYEAVK